MSNIHLWFVQQLIGALLVKLDTPTVKKGVDSLLDIIEDAVADSPNEYDDLIVLPLVNQLRIALDVPDNDDVEPVSK